MSHEFLSRSLFRPFQTTRKTGWHWDVSKQNDRRGTQSRLEVESEPGKGTTFALFAL